MPGDTRVRTRATYRGFENLSGRRGPVSSTFAVSMDDGPCVDPRDGLRNVMGNAGPQYVYNGVMGSMIPVLITPVGQIICEVIVSI